jgi:dipeptidyl aminopeptidase/acylaminoacyl peptidase
MNSWRLLLVGVVCSIGLPAATAADAVPRYDARTFFETTSYGGASFSADESRLLLSSDAGGVFNAYSQPVAGGTADKLTNSSKNAIFGVSYFPKDNRILYTEDEGGNELNHLYAREVDGKVRDLTPGQKLKAMFVGWSGDLGTFYAATNERDSHYFDLYRYDAGNYERALVFKNSDGYTPGVISRDGRWLALVKVRNNADNDIFLWDSQTPAKEPVKITPHDGDVEHEVQTFSPDSATLYFASNQDSEFQKVYAYDLKSGTRKPAVEDQWDVLGISFSWKGGYQVVSVNADARTVTTVTDLKAGKRLQLPELTRAQVGGSVTFPRSERLAAFYADGDTSPRDLHVFDPHNGQHRKLTASLNPKIKEEHLVTSQVIRYPSFDELKIPALLYKPHGASPEHKVPALVFVHGGPGGQCRIGYNPDIQFLVNHGYAVLAVNNRGSSGYGKTFFHMDDRKHGDVDLKDVVNGRRYLETLDWVDGKRVGIIGGSYGGYMVCAALAFEPDAFDVGIDIFGVTNWLRTLESIPPWWASFRDSLYAEMGDPKTDRERLRRISPLFHAKNIRKPLLVVQGANDPRVLKVESDEMVQAVRDRGVPVEYIIFPDEGHGFLKKENRITAAEAYVKFLDRYLAGKK